VRHRRAPYLAAVAVLALALAAPPADARTVTIRQAGAPQLTFTLPAGWRLREARHHAVVTRGRARFVLRQCPLWRDERDMSGRHSARSRPRHDAVAVPARGGSCLVVTGEGAPAFGRRLRPRLGPGTPAPRSDADAERLARAARERTLGKNAAFGTAFAIPHGFSRRIEGTFEWDLAARYQRNVLRFGNVTAEVVRNARDNYVRDEFPCWGKTSPAEDDDALEPRLELRQWDAPPATATSWRVAYAPAEPQPDGSTLVRWTGFVADGEALIGPDGLLRRVRIDDHRQAIGRTIWRTVEIAFTGFPATVAQVVPEPAC
jgi:hypothetical protein